MFSDWWDELALIEADPKGEVQGLQQAWLAVSFKGRLERLVGATLACGWERRLGEAKGCMPDGAGRRAICCTHHTPSSALTPAALPPSGPRCCAGKYSCPSIIQWSDDTVKVSYTVWGEGLRLATIQLATAES